jgi:hypothetical protein
MYPGCGMLSPPACCRLLMPAPLRLTLAGGVAAHARAGHGGAYEVDVPALVERLRGSPPCSSWP